MIPFDKYEQNFTFIVNGKRYKTSRVIADLLSPTIRNYHFQDPTIDEFTINTTNNNTEKNSEEIQKEDYFNEFLNLNKFERIHIEESQRKKFSQYFLQLGNTEELLNLQHNLFEMLEPENVIDKINEIIEILQKSQTKSTNFIEFKLDENVNKIINFAASHFSEIPKEKKKKLNEEILEEIISNESFKIESEEELIEFIIEKYEEDRNFYRFFEYVEFQNVDQNTIENFISVFNIDDLSIGTWKKICKRLISSNDNDIIFRYVKKKI